MGEGCVRVEGGIGEGNMMQRKVGNCFEAFQDYSFWEGARWGSSTGREQERGEKRKAKKKP